MEQLVISAAEAAAALNMSDKETLEWLESGELPGYRVGRNWKVPVSLLRAYVVSRAEAEAAERRTINEEVQNQKG